MRKYMFLLAVLMLFSCGKKRHEQGSQPLSLKDQLIQLNDTLIEQAIAIRDPDTAWVVADDCDSMLWNGKMACNDKVTWFNPRLAEYPDQIGRYTRKPLSKGTCWPHAEGENGSAATWSRDMGHGLAAYAICKADLTIVTEHIRFGEENSIAGIWNMGEPIADGRALYTPSFMGMWYQMRYALGGEDSLLRKTPDIYPSGLDDYHAHLQVLNIWNRMLTAERIGDTDQLPQKSVEAGSVALMDDIAYLSAEIKESMYLRLKEHAGREPGCPFFSAMFHHFEDGIYDQAAESLLSGSEVNCSYVRCNGKPDCHIAEKLFVIQQILNWVE
jgi:hypothetical protein